MNWRPSVGPCRPTLCTSPPYCGMSEKLTSWTASGDLLALWPLVGFVHWRGQQKTRGQVRAFVPGHPPCQATVGGLCEGPQLLSSGPLWTHPHSRLNSCSFHLPLPARGGSCFMLFLNVPCWFPFININVHWRRKWQPTPVFLPGESQGLGSLVGCRLWGRTESDMTEAT